MASLLKKATLTTYFLGAAGDKDAAHRWVYCVGRSTTFVATRDFRKSNEFTISDVEHIENSEVGPLNKAAQSFSWAAGKFLFAAYKSDLLDVENLLTDPYYKIINAEQITEINGPVLKIHYISNKTQNGSPLDKGVVEVLPNHAWAVKRHDLEFLASMGTRPGARQKKLRSVMTVEYGDDQGGMPIPQRVQYTSDVEGEAVFEFDEFDLGATTPESEFTLSYYQLPDVTIPAADPAHGYAVYWIFGLSALAFVAALVIRRRDRTPSTETP